MAKISVSRKYVKGEEGTVVERQVYTKVAGLTFWDRKTEWGDLFKWENSLVDIHDCAKGLSISHVDVSQILKIAFDGPITIGVKADKEVFPGCYVPKVIDAYIKCGSGCMDFNHYDGKPTIEIHYGDDEVFDAHIGNLAYIKFEN